jgi:hypothetical protein
VSGVSNQNWHDSRFFVPTETSSVGTKKRFQFALHNNRLKQGWWSFIPGPTEVLQPWLWERLAPWAARICHIFERWHDEIEGGAQRVSADLRESILTEMIFLRCQRKNHQREIDGIGPGCLMFSLISPRFSCPPVQSLSSFIERWVDRESRAVRSACLR